MVGYIGKIQFHSPLKRFSIIQFRSKLFITEAHIRVGAARWRSCRLLVARSWSSTPPPVLRRHTALASLSNLTGVGIAQAAPVKFRFWRSRTRRPPVGTTLLRRFLLSLGENVTALQFSLDALAYFQQAHRRRIVRIFQFTCSDL